MRVEVRPAGELGPAVAAEIAARLAAAVGARGRAVLALSGGSTPRPMFEALATHDLPWERVDVVQVDERVAPDGDPARNLAAIERALVAAGPLPAARLHPMPVTAGDLDAAAAGYARLLARLAPGTPPVLDVVHLGLGADGHTASLFPGDLVVARPGLPVGVTGPARGHRRMTLTIDVLDAARHLVWMVAGADKSGATAGLLAADPRTPAGSVDHRRAVLFATPEAMPDDAP